MIGVLSGRGQDRAVNEFFELFKTPWEYYRPGNKYDVLLCTDTEPIDSSADLVLVYSAEPRLCDWSNGIQVKSQQTGGFVDYRTELLPIYGKRATLLGNGVAVLLDRTTQETVGLVIPLDERVFVRIGFDLFEEIRVSLTRGQPAVNSSIPTVELHIAFLRDLLVSFSTLLVEIPPIPANYPFIVCLTHDVDHVAVRNHRWDYTTFGFLYRAVIGSLVDAIHQRARRKNERSQVHAFLRSNNPCDEFWCRAYHVRCLFNGRVSSGVRTEGNLGSGSKPLLLPGPRRGWSPRQ